MQNPAGPGVMRASIRLVWHLRRIDGWTVMELALIRRERETPSHRWMPLGAVMRHLGTMPAAALTNIDHLPEPALVTPNTRFHVSSHF